MAIGAGLAGVGLVSAGKTTAATLSAIATGAGLAGTAISAIGAIRQGNTQSKVLKQQAERDRQQAASDEGDFRARQSRAMASRRAGLGAAGIDQAKGSPLLVAQDFAGETELQALRIRTGGEVTATRAEQQAQLQKTKGQFRAGSLLFSGAGKAFE